LGEIESSGTYREEEKNVKILVQKLEVKRPLG
jgi:hypothetical protein